MEQGQNLKRSGGDRYGVRHRRSYVLRSVQRGHRILEAPKILVAFHAAVFWVAGKIIRVAVVDEPPRDMDRVSKVEIYLQAALDV